MHKWVFFTIFMENLVFHFARFLVYRSKNLVETAFFMIGNSPNQSQTNLFSPHFSAYLNMKNELILLAQEINWQYFEESFKVYYSHTGQPALPIRLMVGCLMLKQLYNLGDESLATAWVQNPYMQYFCGYSHFQHAFPFDPSDFVHFRKRIGEEGVEKIFKYSVDLHGKEADSSYFLSDTTVQENNTTFPTDAKLAKQIIDNCNNIAKKEGVIQRQTYIKKSKEYVRNCYNSTHPRRAKKARKSIKKLRTIAFRLLRELERKLSDTALLKYAEKLALYAQVLEQQRKDKNKIYSLHKPFTACIAKGKAGKTYEFGNKIGLLVHPKTLLVVGVEAYKGNPNDSKTIEPLLDQYEKNFKKLPKEIVYDRGGAGKTKIKGVEILTPKKPKKTDTIYQKRQKRIKFRRRAAIEPVIGHLKSQFRMEKNYLHGNTSPKINALLTATAWNLKKWMKKAQQSLLFFCLIFSSLFLQFYTQKKSS